ncbi:MAG: protein-L-isoaspartate(D-aspartate) O-methyltransferase [Chloroflexota bacterium]
MRWPRFSRPRNPADDHVRERARMVAEQLEARGISDPELLRAFGAVERHRFVEGDEPYGDHALPVGSGQTISQPYVVAVMTATAQPPGGWRDANVLEVGTGSGYQAALLAEMGGRVTTIERHESLAETARQRLADAGYGDRVDVVVGDGTQGWEPRAPYRSILVTAGGPSVPEPLLEQLDRSGGRLVIPVGDREHQFLTLVVREDDELSTTEMEPVVFVPLIGKHGHRAD